MIRLHANLFSGNSYKVRLLLGLLGVPYEMVEYDTLEGQTRTPEYLENVNPDGRIPVLELEDGTLLPESGAILFYLAEDTPYLPGERMERARVLQWMFFEQYSHGPNLSRPRFWLMKGFEITPERRTELDQKRTLGYDALGVMERHLEGRHFFVRDRYSIADIALYAYTHVADEGGFDLGPFPAVRAWLDRVASQPGHVPITQAQAG